MPPPRFPVSPHSYFGYTSLSSSGLISAGPCFVLGVLMTPEGKKRTVALYNGQDDAPMGFFHTYQLGDDLSQDSLWPYPIYFNRGLYVVLHDSITYFTIIWAPVPREYGEPTSPSDPPPVPST